MLLKVLFVLVGRPEICPCAKQHIETTKLDVIPCQIITDEIFWSINLLMTIFKDV